MGVIKLKLNKYIRMILEMTKINNLRNEILFNILLSLSNLASYFFIFSL